jgi:hypothetical protein
MLWTQNRGVFKCVSLKWVNLKAGRGTHRAAIVATMASIGTQGLGLPVGAGGAASRSRPPALGAQKRCPVGAAPSEWITFSCIRGSAMPVAPRSRTRSGSVCFSQLSGFLHTLTLWLRLRAPPTPQSQNG